MIKKTFIDLSSFFYVFIGFLLSIPLTQELCWVEGENIGKIRHFFGPCVLHRLVDNHTVTFINCNNVFLRRWNRNL